MKHRIYLADLTHTSLGIHASTFPLGTAFVASYAHEILGDRFKVKLFKFPEDLCSAISENKPDILALSNYSWNLELGYAICVRAKRQYPNLVVIFGGPNFPVDHPEKINFLKARPAVDFYIQNEGEVAFAKLIQSIYEYKFNADALKKDRLIVPNCNYLIDGNLIEGDVSRIDDLNKIPSPYLSGLLDDFFNFPLAPMVETTRGCPFTCAFCADGLLSKSRVFRFEESRVRQELKYISDRIKNVDELIITDLNFGMYDDDIKTAQAIAELQKEKHWPVIVSGSAGKNRPKKVIETISILAGSWKVGSAIQSSDPDVLRAIKRNNISLDSFQQVLDYGNNVSNESSSYTEVILALPGDTKQKHFESLRYGIENGAFTLRMYQAMLLLGTEMASQETRRKYDLKTKFRIIPGGFGTYKFGCDNFRVAEIEEIVVASKDMSFDDYLSCRKMNLIIETYLNNALFEEILAPLKAMGIPSFDCFVYLHQHEELFTPKIRKLINDFTAITEHSLFESREEAETYMQQPEIMEKFISGELGINELLIYRAKLYQELHDITFILTQSIKNILIEKDMFTPEAGDFFDQMGKFILCRKKDFFKYQDVIEQEFDYDFEAFSKVKYLIDPRHIQKCAEPISLKFFHTPSQAQHIRNSMNLYANTPSGIGRLIQRSNLKKMYRRFTQQMETNLSQ